MELSYGKVRNHDRRPNRVGTVHECDRLTDGFTMSKTALCIVSRAKNQCTGYHINHYTEQVSVFAAEVLGEKRE